MEGFYKNVASSRVLGRGYVHLALVNFLHVK